MHTIDQIPALQGLDPMQKAIRISGGIKSLAESIGKSPATIYHWQNRGVPLTAVKLVAEFTGVAEVDLLQFSLSKTQHK
ncbi:YdaS family helix-turn-helix protein [Limnobacter sp.]|uniref:YdaS family helix-turn-helix protein n=1 Tax=Limnobacter sp. TaxID=2003368 RepID=UPI0025BC7FC5|nr:YdaS family helix-turn-helix protein [Limnobacter sp.]